MTKRRNESDSFRQPEAHRKRMVQPKEHDSYKQGSKPKEATVCEDCEVSYFGGKWSWSGPPPTHVHSGVCPACRRIRDRYPAGTIRIRGGFDRDREELRNMCRNVEAREKAEHPLERLMDIQEDDEGVIVTTTGTHIARCIAGALRRQYHGHVQVTYPSEQNLIFVDWKP